MKSLLRITSLGNLEMYPKYLHIPTDRITDAWGPGKGQRSWRARERIFLPTTPWDRWPTGPPVHRASVGFWIKFSYHLINIKHQQYKAYKYSHWHTRRLSHSMREWRNTPYCAAESTAKQIMRDVSPHCRKLILSRNCKGGINCKWIWIESTSSTLKLNLNSGFEGEKHGKNTRTDIPHIFMITYSILEEYTLQLNLKPVRCPHFKSSNFKSKETNVRGTLNNHSLSLRWCDLEP